MRCIQTILITKVIMGLQEPKKKRTDSLYDFKVKQCGLALF